jgi:integrase
MSQGEVAGLCRSDINFETRLICVSRSFYGPTKNGETRFVPILDPLLEPLQKWIASHPFDYVFPNAAGNLFTNSARIFDQIFHECLKESGLHPYYDGKRWRPYITYHDLRHTFASHWVMRGGSLFKLQKILGHQTIEMTLRYAHLSPTAFQEDLSRMNSPSSFANVITLNAQGQQR